MKKLSLVIVLVSLITMLCVPLINAWEPEPYGDPCENLDPKYHIQAYQCYFMLMIELGVDPGQINQW